ncbi:MAG: acyl carrier protein [Thermodesulfobacteriota bacterium]|jgi:acyl carrier protein
MSDEIRKRIRKVLNNKINSDLKPEMLKDDTPLLELGIGADSIATLELIVALESEFNISINEDDVGPGLIETIDSIADYIIMRLEVLTE